MATELVPIAELHAFLGLSEAEIAADEVLESLTDQVQAIFERACGRDDRPFQGPEEGRVEIRDGSGSPALWLDYAPSAVTEILLGHDSADPDETLDADDKSVVVWGTSSRRIQRVDGHWFGALGAPRYVQVTYDAAEDLPDAAKLAVMAGVAYVWRRRGSEEASAERIGAYETQLLNDLSSNVIAEPTWMQGIRLLSEPRL